MKLALLLEKFLLARRHSYLARVSRDFHRLTLARRIGLGRGRSCRQRSKAAPRPRGPRTWTLPGAGCCFRAFLPEPWLAYQVTIRAAALPEGISSSSHLVAGGSLPKLDGRSSRNWIIELTGVPTRK